MRTFIAVELDVPTKEAVSRLVRQLAATITGVRWVKPENIHITIRFLGETPPDTCAKVERILQDVARETAPFSVTLSGLGAFPGFRRPRVLWIGVENGREELKRLYSGIEKKLKGIGIPTGGRSYTPHITIGRLRHPKGSEKLAGLARKSRLDSNFAVDKIVFIESKLGPGGAVHKALYEAPLKYVNG